jgi:DNA-binding NtrC family response regulator
MSVEPFIRSCPAAIVGAVSAAMPDIALILVDAACVVRAWGLGAERLTGMAAADRVGAPLPPELFVPTVSGGLDALLLHRPGGVRRADGARTAVEGGIRPIAGDDGQRLGAVIALRALREAAWSEPPDAVRFHRLLSRDPRMLHVFEMIRNVGETEATVLVRGESGTGKELVAAALHAESRRSKGPFVAVNCAAFPAGTLESELFGHKRGAFTGAVADHDGIFIQAEGGTLFLDEVAELPLDVQAKLLRVLQERVVTPVGGTRPLKVDVRVVAATHRALRQEVKAGRFREDLLYRLRVVPLFLPPLRERPLDIELLLWQFIREHNAAGPRRIASVAGDALRALLAWPWPGNIRELWNVVEYAAAVSREPELSLADLPPELQEEEEDALASPVGRRESGAAADADEEELIRAALAEAGGDLNAAAAKLGMSRTTFWRKRRRLGIDAEV